VLAQVDIRIGRDQLHGVLHLALRQRVARGNEPANLFDETGDGAGVTGLALDEQVVSLRADADVQQAFEMPQVVVVGPEDRGQAVFRDGDTARGNGSDRDISLCYKELTDLLQPSTPGRGGQASRCPRPRERPDVNPGGGAPRLKPWRSIALSSES